MVEAHDEDINFFSGGFVNRLPKRHVKTKTNEIGLRSQDHTMTELQQIDQEIQSMSA